MDNKKYTEEDVGRAQKRVERLAKLLRIKLRQNLPYYGFIITKLSDIIFTTQIRTAATDGLNILVNPSFMINKSDKAINFILMHELLHVVFMHRTRFEKNKLNYNAQLWNIAGDYVINYELCSQENILKAAGIDIEFPGDGLLMRNDDGSLKDISNYTTEQIYAEITDLNIENKNSSMGSDVTEELPILADNVRNTPQEIERVVKNTLRELAQKNYDIKSESFSRLINNSVKTTKIRWDIYLRKFLSSQITDENSYDTPNRKYLPYDLIMPGPGAREELLDDVFIFVDTSGSINDEELQKALNNAYTISHDYRASISLAFWDTKVSQVIQDIQPDEIKKRLENLEFTTGGTDINCVLDYIKEKKLDSAAFVVFTDGEFTIPAIEKKIKRKMVIALEDTINYNKELDTLGKIVSFNEKE